MKKYTKEELYKMDAVDVYKMVLKKDTIKIFPQGFWQQPEAKQNAAKCTRYLFEEILRYDENDIRMKNSASIYEKNKLTGMILSCFNGSPYKAINNAYPGRFKEWEFKNVPIGFWSEETGILATKWLLEEKLNYNEDDIKESLSSTIFKENGLKIMLGNCFNGSPYEAINTVYPGRFKEWELKCVPQRYWQNKENGIRATRWLIEEKLKLSDEELKEQLSKYLFENNKLSGMLQKCFNGSPYEAINTLYPGKFKEWEFKCVPQKYWQNKENGIRATRWLVEEKLKLSDTNLIKNLNANVFLEHGLESMLKSCFNNSHSRAILETYPNIFLKSDLI